MLRAIISALVVNKAALFVANDHSLPKSPRGEKRRQKLNAGYSCKRCRYDLIKKTKQQQKKRSETRANINFKLCR